MSAEDESPGRADVRAVVAEGRRDAAERESKTLLEAGYGSVSEADNETRLRALVTGGSPDLLIVGSDLAGGDVNKLLRDIRAGEVGRNPFLVIIMTSWSQDRNVVGKAIDAGVDDFLVQPVSPARLLERIGVQVHYRRPFIATHDYVGPDRRQDPNRPSNVPHHEVPNTLANKELNKPGRADKGATQAAIDRSKIALADEKLKRSGFQIAFLVNLVLDSLSSGTVGSETAVHAFRVESMARLTVMKLMGSQYAGAAELCEQLAGVAGAVSQNMAQSSRRDRELLRLLSIAMVKSFYPEEGEEELVSQIAETVKRFKERAAGGEG